MKNKLIKWLGGYTEGEIQSKREDLLNLVTVEIFQDLHPRLKELNNLDTYFKVKETNISVALKSKIKNLIVELFDYYL